MSHFKTLDLFDIEEGLTIVIEYQYSNNQLSLEGFSTHVEGDEFSIEYRNDRQLLKLIEEEVNDFLEDEWATNADYYITGEEEAYWESQMEASKE